MFPWGHAAVAYLLYAGHQRVRYGLGPREAPALALAVGTQLPDLIDKPLTYQFAVLPSGRSFGHSLLVAALVLGVLWVLVDRPDHRSLVGAFGVGYVSHLLGDGLYPALAGDFGDLRFLAYPVVEPIQYDVSSSFVTYVLQTILFVGPSPTVLFEFGLTAVALALWYRDGLPGLRLLVPSRFTGTADQPE